VNVVKRVGRGRRSQHERIIIKWAQPSAGERSTKSVLCGHGRSGGRENTYAKQKYTPGSSRARGVTKSISFFLLIIGFKG
jgi:hypothetical protein